MEQLKAKKRTHEMKVSRLLKRHKDWQILFVSILCFHRYYLSSYQEDSVVSKESEGEEQFSRGGGARPDTAWWAGLLELH